MSDENKVVKVIKSFIDFTKIFDLIYVNKKESKQNINKSYKELESAVNDLIDCLVEDFELIDQNLNDVGKEISIN